MRARQFLIVAIFACDLIAQITFCQQPTARRAKTCAPDPTRHVPYSAEFTLTDVKPGPNGTLVTTTILKCRLSIPMVDPWNCRLLPIRCTRGRPGSLAETCDPVSNTQMQWDSRRNRVTVLAMPKPEERQGCWESELGDFTISFADSEVSRRFRGGESTRPGCGIRQTGQSRRSMISVRPQSRELRCCGTRTTWPPASARTR